MTEPILGDDAHSEQAVPRESIPTLGATLADRYRLDALIGQGGMSFVYAAHDVVLGKRVAVKVLRGKFRDRQDLVQRFLREAQAAVRVPHPIVIEVLDFGTAASGAAFTVLEFLEGETLASTLAREGPMPWRRVRAVALQLCSALGAAHGAGVVHRDVTLGNVFHVPREGNADAVKLVDFGIARLLDTDDITVAGPRLTTELDVFGTPAFMAPEQVRRSSEADARSDVYSLGIVLFTLLTGRLPFEGRSSMQLLHQQLHDQPPPPHQLTDGIPVAVESLVLRALEKDPAARFQSMAEFAEAISAVPASAAAPTSSHESPFRSAASALGLAAGVLIIALWLAFS